jgi:hypothetical protein
MVDEHAGFVRIKSRRGGGRSDSLHPIDVDRLWQPVSRFGEPTTVAPELAEEIMQGSVTCFLIDLMLLRDAVLGEPGVES